VFKFHARASVAYFSANCSNQVVAKVSLRRDGFTYNWRNSTAFKRGTELRSKQVCRYRWRLQNFGRSDLCCRGLSNVCPTSIRRIVVLRGDRHICYPVIRLPLPRLAWSGRTRTRGSEQQTGREKRWRSIEIFFLRRYGERQGHSGQK